MPAAILEEVLKIFAEVVAVDPVSGLLFLFGNVVLLGSIAVFALLSLGGVLALRRGLHG